MDTIFIDLENYHVEGTGIKKSEFTNKIAEEAENNISSAKLLIREFFDDIIEHNYDLENQDTTTLSLIHRIESKMGLRNAWKK